MLAAVSVVKNAADVIETMIRANSLYVEAFVIVNHGCTDRTVEILESLAQEGFRIELLDAQDGPSHLQKSRMEEGIRYALQSLHPDFILPLDDDEILVSERPDMSTEAVKASIEGLDQDALYYISWRNYIPTEEDDPNEVCVAKRLTFCFDDEPEMTKKILIPAKVAAAEDFTIAQGNHFADSAVIAKRVYLKDLRLAHFPIRSPEQVASKALVGWLNHLTMPHRDPDTAYHWERMYHSVLRAGLPGVELMQAMCTLYREYPNDEEHLNVVQKPLNLPGKCTQLKYTHRLEINIIKNVCLDAEGIALAYARLLEENEKQSGG